MGLQSLPTKLNLYEWEGKKHFVSFKLEDQMWVRTRDPRLCKQAALTTALYIYKRDTTVTLSVRGPSLCRVVLSEAVDGCICLTRKIQHGGDWERSRTQGPKNVDNFLMTLRSLSWACGHGTEKLLIQKKNYFWPDYSPIFSDMTVQRNVPRFCAR